MIGNTPNPLGRLSQRNIFISKNTTTSKKTKKQPTTQSNINTTATKNDDPWRRPKYGWKRLGKNS